MDTIREYELSCDIALVGNLNSWCLYFSRDNSRFECREKSVVYLTIQDLEALVKLEQEKFMDQCDGAMFVLLERMLP